jgi:hypothetical protein
MVLFLAHVVNAQQQDTVMHKSEGVVSKVRQPLQTIQGKTPNGNLSLSSVTDTLKTPKLDSLAAKQKLDSIKGVVAAKKAAVNSVTDSIKRIVNLPQDKINQLNSAIQSQQDSLLGIINKPINDVNSSISETQQTFQSKITGEQTNIQNKVQGKMDGVENDVQQNISKATDGKANLANGELKIPGAESALPVKDLKLDNVTVESAKIPGMETGVPKVDMPKIETPKLPDTKLDMKSLGEKADVNLDAVNKVTGEVSKVQGQIGNIDGKLAEAEQYENEIRNINENGLKDAEKLPEEIEKKAGDMAGIKTLNAEKEKVMKYKSVVERYKDEKLMKEEIQRKLREVANDKVNQYTAAVKDAQKHIANAKKINPAVQAYKDITRKRPNQMKGKPFRQRFIPGITLQAYNGEKFAMDVAAQAGYRVTGRLTTGIGYTYRISISDKNTNIVRGEGISGYRAYVDFRLLKSFFAHGEFESLSLDARKQPKLFETLPSQTYGSYFGLGKRYNVSRKIKGSVTGLYRVDYKGEVPGLSKLTLRIGFDLNLNKHKSKFLPD